MLQTSHEIGRFRARSELARLSRSPDSTVDPRLAVCVRLCNQFFSAVEIERAWEEEERSRASRSAVALRCPSTSGHFGRAVAVHKRHKDSNEAAARGRRQGEAARTGRSRAEIGRQNIPKSMQSEPATTRTLVWGLLYSPGQSARSACACLQRITSRDMSDEREPMHPRRIPAMTGLRCVQKTGSAPAQCFVSAASRKHGFGPIIMLPFCLFLVSRNARVE